MATDDFAADFAVAGAQIIFRDNGLGRNLKQGPDRVKRAAFTTAQVQSPRVENYMKVNAPWNDQTGNARNGLSARPFMEGDDIGIVCSHSVSYGIWLEVRWNGRYAIIQPTIDTMGPVVMRSFTRLMDRM